MNFVSRITKVNLARQQELAAKQEALQRGMVATKPLNADRLAELCELGERMLAAERARMAAEDSLFANLNVPRVDYELPKS